MGKMNTCIHRITTHAKCWIVAILIIQSVQFNNALTTETRTGNLYCRFSSDQFRETSPIKLIHQRNSLAFSKRNRERIRTISIVSSLGYGSIQNEPFLSGIDNMFDGTLDTETRRQQRLERLKSQISSTAKRLSRSISSRVMGTPEVTLEEDKSSELETTTNTDHDSDCENKSNGNLKDNFVLGPDFISDLNQHNSILSESPAILLESSAGTGKTTVLAGRIAHLLQSKKIEPQHMIVLSFTKRDATTLKDKALNLLYKHDSNGLESREIMEKKLWSGTIHSFAINILQKYSQEAPLRIISTREMRNRIRQCLGRINSTSNETMMLYKEALDDTRQSINILVQHMLRCLELWKEAGVLPSPYVSPIDSPTQNTNAEQEHNVSRDDFIELAMRLGIPQSAAALALEISGDYQTLHASMGTSDPSDVATIAYEFLLKNPKALQAIRSKLHQVILDEYQDVSVSQHQLLRLILTGKDNHAKSDSCYKFPVLLNERRDKNRKEDLVCYQVPKLCAAGDANQSIYGWRGAAPVLTVDGFRRDFPQGIVVPLTTSYRLPRNILNAANVLLGHNEDIGPEPISFATSPAAMMTKKSLVEKHALLQIEDGVMNESKSSVFIQGLWDAREEAKFIASEIRRRSKERVDLCAKAFRQLTEAEQDSHDSDDYLFDSSEVAIMVRSKNEMKLFKEALEAHGVPYVTPSAGKLPSSFRKIQYHKKNQHRVIPMTPCKLITMHQAKGDEFDDVYLAGWTEGNFPHPSSVKTNRLHEERRIAYVALTRARQKVIMTYSFIKRTAYFGPKGERKDVTEQVKPSRFLYDLMPKSSKRNMGGVEWSNKVGFKEVIAGKDLPSHFAKSYRIPDGYRSNKAVLKVASKSTSRPSSKNKSDDSSGSNNGAMLQILKVGLNSIFTKERGACKKYRPIFRKMLKENGIHRGSAIVLTRKARNDVEKDLNCLSNARKDQLTTRPLSRCRAEELGLYLVHLLDGDDAIAQT